MSTQFSEPINLISAWLDAQIDYKKIPSMTAGIIAENQLIWCRGFGYADIDKGIKATPETVYSICSISKLFTSIAILQLRDQKRLNLDDHLSEHLPWFKINESFPKSGPVTIRSLLTHTSGLPRESDAPYWTDPQHPFPTDAELKERLFRQETLYPTATFYQYSNLGMSLLGSLITELSGIPYEQYITQHILTPLGLNQTYTDLAIPHKMGELATGYGIESRQGERKPLPLFNTRAVTSAAGFGSSVADLARFALWQLQALKEVDDPILNGNTLREMQRPHWVDPVEPITRGLGFGVEKWDKTTVVGHSGGCPGYLTKFVLIPKRGWSLILMANGLGINVAQYLQSIYQVIDEYDSFEGDAVSEPGRFDAYAGRYDSFWDGETYITPWKGKLAIFLLRAESQKKPVFMMQQVEGDRFRRIGEDEELKEEIRFERDQDNRVIRFWRHSQYTDKLVTGG